MLGSTPACNTPPSSALTVPNFGCGCVLSAVATTMPEALPFRVHVAPWSMERFRKYWIVFGFAASVAQLTMQFWWRL